MELFHTGSLSWGCNSGSMLTAALKFSQNVLNKLLLKVRKYQRPTGKAFCLGVKALSRTQPNHSIKITDTDRAKLQESHVYIHFPFDKTPNT